MLRDVMAAEALALRKRPAAWTLLGAWLVMAMLFGYLFPYLGSQGDGGAFGDSELSSQLLLASTLPEQLVPTVTSGLPLFGGALALVLGALVAGSPYGWGTLKTALTSRVRRVPLIVGTMTLLTLVLLGMVLVTFGVGAIVSTAIATAEDQPISWPSLADLALGIGGGWLIVTAWCAIGVLAGTLARSTALSIGLGLVWALVVENLIRGLGSTLGWLETFSKVLPGVNAGSVAAALVPSGVPIDTPGVAAMLSGTTGALVLVGYVVVATAVAALVLQRRDLA
jgi:ABC-2 type transport system permease protein